MATIERFEDLLVWKKGRLLTKEIYQALRSCHDMGFRDQIQRAAVSIISNIAEGFERGTRQEFLNYLFIAKGSAGEVRAQLYVALDVGYLNIEIFTSLNDLVTQCSKLLSSFIEKVKGGSRRGTQFKQVRKGDVFFERMLREHNMVRLPDGRVVSKEESPESL